MNERRYGTDIGRIGPMLLAERYDDRTHFIFELLQNAEDALARRVGWHGSRLVTFSLTPTELRVTHCGQPFDERDVRGICGILESTKDLTAIGRFGIGFKSVYAFTDRPEVHSGDENFAIESFVWPNAATPVDRIDDETVIVLPVKTGDQAAHEAIIKGFQRLGPGTLLFLRQIEEIAWTVEGGPSGLYLRSKPEVITEHVRRLSVIGQEERKTEIEETWLVFSRPVRTDDGATVGHVEIAFAIAQDDELGRDTIRPVRDSPLVVFFPTVLPTHLGFLVQGPYRTTPSRDNVPRNDPWNQYLVEETATLLVAALRWLRDHDMIDTTALRSLPLDSDRFGEGSMFAPLFKATRQALKSEPLLPRIDGGHVAAANGRLARTQELRELFSPGQLAALFGHDEGLAWLSADITQDRTPELRQYLMRELGVTEVTPETILSKLDATFLESQTDDWVRELYEFLNGQPALLRHGRLDDVPLVRLERGEHIAARSNGQPLAFLPSTTETGFPTVRRAVCHTDEARKFLQSLGLTEPDPVDDVIRNVLPQYCGEDIDINVKQYEADVRRILTAFTTDSKTQREKLITTLRESTFVMAVDAGDGSKRVSRPTEVYLATERLKELFAGIEIVLLVDDTYSCLRGEDVRELLEACGATRYLQPIPVESDLSWEQRNDIRRTAGLERSTWEGPLSDLTLRGLDLLLNRLPRLEPKARRRRAALLWDALADVESRRGSKAFVGEYTWGYSHETKTAPFDAASVRTLNETAWVPIANDELARPEFVLFDTLGWKPNPFLQSRIRFKPPVLETLAREAGIEAGVLDLLKKHGVTSVAELVARLGIEEEPPQTEGKGKPATANDARTNHLADAPEPSSATPDAIRPEAPPPRGGEGQLSAAVGGSGTGADGGPQADTRPTPRGEDGGDTRTTGSAGGRPFVSYVAAHPDEESPDPDGLDHQARLALEEKALQLIIAAEPQLQRTPTHNPGYDLFEADAEGRATRWIEVKAMKGGLQDRPVGLSRAQFECARQQGEAYWLYVVEHTGEDCRARIARIQDPAGKARTFTFDHGWLHVANVGNVLDKGGGESSVTATWTIRQPAPGSTDPS